MATYALIHGGGGAAWDWHRVAPLLEAAGHRVVAVDLPSDDDATLDDYASAVTEAVGAADDVIVVGHSLGGFTAPLVAERLRARLLVLVSAMIPAPGESVGGWWDASGWTRDVGVAFDDALFYHDVPAALEAEARTKERGESETAMSEPFGGWPAGIPVEVVAFADDRLFPVAFQRRLARERLGTETVTEVPGGHYGAISQPDALAAALLRLST